jgi:hypothetical protein
MKKKLTFIIIICAIICISTSCARKINGATPHRRDRNCGCENIYENKSVNEEAMLTQNNGEADILSPPAIDDGMVAMNER